MIKNNFLTCPKCISKIQPISKGDIVFATVYCYKCKEYYRVEIEDGKLSDIRKEIAS